MADTRESRNQYGLIMLVVACGILLLGALWYSATIEVSPDEADIADLDVEAAADTAAVNSPTFDIVRISRGGTGVVAGRAAPRSTVELLANGTKVAEVVADENGEWVAILDEPLSPGSAEFNLIARIPGQDEVMSEDVLVVSVPEREEDRFVGSEGNGVVAVRSPRDGDGASTIMQKPGGKAFAEVGESLAIDSIDYGGEHNAVVSGRSLPRVDIWLYLDDENIATARASDDGFWSVDIDGEKFTPGQHILRADQTISEGNVKLRVEQPFELGIPLDPSRAENGIIVQPGNSLWAIARQLYGSGVRYTVIFRENSEQIADPDLIYPGQIFRVPGNDQGSNSGEGAG